MSPHSCQLLDPPSSPDLRNNAPKPSVKRKRAAAQKISELSCLERRLLAASIRSERAGHVRRASSYLRQATAVRQELQSWTLLENNPTPSPPQPLPHLVAAVFCAIPPIFDFFVATGHAAKRLSRAVVTIVLVLCGILLGTSTTHSWQNHHLPEDRPEHWVTEIASSELSRKGSHGSMTSLLRQ